MAVISEDEINKILQRINVSYDPRSIEFAFVNRMFAQGEWGEVGEFEAWRKAYERISTACVRRRLSIEQQERASYWDY